MKKLKRLLVFGFAFFISCGGKTEKPAPPITPLWQQKKIGHFIPVKKGPDQWVAVSDLGDTSPIKLTAEMAHAIEKAASLHPTLLMDTSGKFILLTVPSPPCPPSVPLPPKVLKKHRHAKKIRPPASKEGKFEKCEC